MAQPWPERIRAQLTDIWNKANGKTKAANIVPVVPASYAGLGLAALAAKESFAKEKKKRNTPE